MSRVSRLALWCTAVLALTSASAALGAGQLLVNGAFSEGEGDKPEGWRTEAWVKAPSATRFSWTVGEDGVGVAGIDSEAPNDAGWIQNVAVTPSTWYRISGWIRSEGVGTDHLGAYVSVLDTFYNSADLRGTQPWQPVVLWVKTKPLETSLRIGCRLGGYSSLNTGSAQFTLISVEAAGTPVAGSPFVYGGTPGGSDQDRPVWVQGVAILITIGIAFVLWRYLLPRADHRSA
jgi:dolichyl-phosphate-mannose-protein mannosyltransferase